MKPNEIIKDSTTNYLYEGLDVTEKREVKLWESAGKLMLEYNMTTDQISQVFQQVETGVTSSGGNRTAIGQGKDVASAVNRAWEDLKTKVQNSAPISDIDSKYEHAAEKLKQATGGDQGVMKYVQKYRDFAKSHPIAQGFIYSALIAAAGISGAGIGGAAALGLFKMVDKLLQGEKFSTAAYSGAKTGGMAYAAGQLGKSLQGDNSAADSASQHISGGPDRLSVDFWKSHPYYGDQLTKAMNDPSITQSWKDEFIAQLNKSVANQENTASLSSAWRMAAKAASARAGNAYGESISISRRQLDMIMEYVVTVSGTQLNEGPMDYIKGKVGQAAQSTTDWLKTKGHNVTTKVTVDKLVSAWKQAGSPSDSLQVAKVIQNYGVSSDIIYAAFKEVGLESPTQTPQTTAASVPSQSQAPDTGTKRAVGNNQKTVQSSGIANLSASQIRSVVANLNKRSAQSLLKYIDSLEQPSQPQSAPQTSQQQSIPAGQTVNFSGKQYKFMGKQWAELSSQGKPALMAPKGIVQQLNALAAANVQKKPQPKVQKRKPVGQQPRQPQQQPQQTQTPNYADMNTPAFMRRKATVKR